MSTSTAMPVFRDFPERFRGSVFRPGDTGYDDARRIFNLRRMSTPALIARCADVADVQASMRYAAEHGTPVAVRGGGHLDGYAAPEGALVLDMSGMRGVTVDPERRVVRAEAGVLLGEFDRATQEHGLATTTGTVTHTGIAGLTLGGGVGFLMRRFGTTVDNLLCCDLVTTGGEAITASADEHPDLFWALRGGGGNFGVVTSFEYRLHPVGPEVARAMLIYPLDQAAEILAQLEEYMRDAPREVMSIVALAPARGLPVPDDLTDKPALIVIAGHTGNPDLAERDLAPVLDAGVPAVKVVERVPYTELNATLDALAPWDHRLHTRGGFLPGLGDEVISLMVERAAQAPPPCGPTPNTALAMWSMGGAVHDFPEDSTAFSRTDARWIFEALAVWQDQGADEAHIAWVDSVDAAMREHRLPNAYINLGAAADPDWLHDAYGGAARYDRLLKAKAQWDPGNLLRFNKNIRPRAAAVSG